MAGQVGFLIIGPGVRTLSLQGPPIPGLSLLYPVCLVVGPTGSSTTHHFQAYSGDYLQLPDGPFDLP